MSKHVVAIEGRYEGDLRVRAVHGPSGAELVTDAPADNHGKGESFSPTDLVGTALATCVPTIIAIAAEKRGLDVSSMRFRVTKEMAADPHRRIARLQLTVWLPAALSDDDRKLLEAAGRGCPVHRSLHPDTDAPVEFVYE